MFLFLTGALILNKKFDDKNYVKKFYKKNLVPLLIAVCSWNIIYYFFIMWFNSSAFSWKGLIYRVLFMKSSAMPHMWYMPMIIGMYIFLPFISIIVKKFNFKDLILPITIVTIASFILPNIKVFLNFFGYTAKDINLILNLSYGGGVYGIYIIVGYYLFNKKILKNIKSRYIIIALIISFTISVLYQMIGYMKGDASIVYYDFFGVLIAGICLFELLQRIRNVKFGNLFTYIYQKFLWLYFLSIDLYYIF